MVIVVNGVTSWEGGGGKGVEVRDWAAGWLFWIVATSGHYYLLEVDSTVCN